MIRLLSGDARDVLPTLPAESVQCVVCSPPYYALRSYLDAAHPDKHREIGSEATPDAYLATMVAVFREVRRVLRRDGTCWVNMGDSYSSGSGGDRRMGDPSNAKAGGAAEWRSEARAQVGAKPKDLLLMPARLALALQADGWWVRSDVIWHKPNPMPESCTDRPTSAYEHVFLLTRSARYFYDADAVREGDDVYTRKAGGYNNHATQMVDGRKPYCGGGFADSDVTTVGRNLRNVWTIATHAYPEAHFATFPPELAERCIKAGTSERGCCAACGKPWGRTTDAMPDARVPYATVGLGAKAAIIGNDGNGLHKVLREDGRGGDLATIQRTTTGWAPGCQCNAATVPCTVLDPFIGAGTTALVADRLQRDCIGIDLNTQYTRMAMDRCIADAPLFTAFPPAEPPEDERMADLFAGDEYERRPAAVAERADAFRNSGKQRRNLPSCSCGAHSTIQCDACEACQEPRGTCFPGPCKLYHGCGGSGGRAPGAEGVLDRRRPEHLAD